MPTNMVPVATAAATPHTSSMVYGQEPQQVVYVPVDQSPLIYEDLNSQQAYEEPPMQYVVPQEQYQPPPVQYMEQPLTYQEQPMYQAPQQPF